MSDSPLDLEPKWLRPTTSELAALAVGMACAPQIRPDPTVTWSNLARTKVATDLCVWWMDGWTRRDDGEDDVLRFVQSTTLRGLGSRRLRG